ncbi:MAG: 30S ribosomal protein S4 [Chloroflexi bacterium]|nr:30S ribosomal protein S4 [Chloroflexota bacterium]
MARYTGPVCRLCRRLGDKLLLKGDRCFSAKCAAEKRSGPPGQHGTSRRRPKVSERGLQLREKQRARYTFEVLEKQFRRHYHEAERRAGATGLNLLQILEMRLDNAVFRMGFAESRRQARQLVRHGHFLLSGRPTNIPSCEVKQGDVIAWAPVSIGEEPYEIAKASIKGRSIPSWVSVDVDNLTGRVISTPPREEMDPRINEQAIVEYYSR